MRNQTKKRARADRLANPVEWAWLANFDRCAICNKRTILTVHHMIEGMNRWRAKGVLAALLPSCWECNSGVLKDKSQYPLARQLAIKKRIDPENFSLAAINKLLGAEGDPSPHQRITMQDLKPYLDAH
jgi:hypothetical protein